MDLNGDKNISFAFSEAKAFVGALADPLGQPSHGPSKPRKGWHHVFCPPLPKAPKKLLFKKRIWVHPKNIGLSLQSFQFWGTLSWDPVPSCAPPPHLKLVAGSASVWVSVWVFCEFVYAIC